MWVHAVSHGFQQPLLERIERVISTSTVIAYPTQLNNEERLAVARRVVSRADGRVSVVASGTFEGSIEEQAAFAREMSNVVDAVVVIVAQMAREMDSDAIWQQNVQRLLDLTPGVMLGLYECPLPYHRLLSADTLQWCVSTQRFLFHKVCMVAEL